MIVTIKVGYFEEEQLEKLSELLEIPKAKVVELIVKNVLGDPELMDKVIN